MSALSEHLRFLTCTGKVELVFTSSGSVHRSYNKPVAVGYRVSNEGRLKTYETQRFESKINWALSEMKKKAH